MPILFVLKCDGTLGSEGPWVAIWAPMWAMDIIFLVIACLVFQGTKNDVDENGEPIEVLEKPSTLLKITNMVVTITFILLQIFILMRLDGYIQWNWFAVFSPWFLYELIRVFICLKVILIPIATPDYEVIKSFIRSSSSSDEENMMKNEEEFKVMKLTLEEEYFQAHLNRQQEIRSMIGYLLRAWQGVFLALKVNGDITWNWGLVLLPIWVYLFVQILYIIAFKLWARYVSKSRRSTFGITGDHEPGIESEIFDRRSSFLQNLSITIFAFTLVQVFMAVLLVSRLEKSVFTTFIIILPVFLILGCCCCSVMCGILILSCVDVDELNQQVNETRDNNNATEKQSHEVSDIIPAEGVTGNIPIYQDNNSTELNNVVIDFPSPPAATNIYNNNNNNSSNESDAFNNNEVAYSPSDQEKSHLLAFTSSNQTEMKLISNSTKINADID